MKFLTLIQNIKTVHDALQANAAKSINISLTLRNWLIGFYIVEFEQNGEDRAKYGEKLLVNLEKQFASSGIKGMNERRFRDYRLFYNIYPQIGLAIKEFLPADTIRRLPTAELSIPGNRRLPTAKSAGVVKKVNNLILTVEKILPRLSYTHLAELIKINDPLKRVFYEIECIKGTWSISELQRQIESLYFERSGLSKDKKKLSELVNQKAIQLCPKDLINDPITVEFLGLSDRALVTESDLEQALLDHLQMFLLELGHGFCFEARQKRIIIDGVYDFIDLVFYNRILKCHVLVDLKTEKFKHTFVGQMNAYLNFYRNEVMQKGDNPPVGILLCTDKGETMVKYATAGLDESIFVHKYMVELPSKEELENYLIDKTQ